MKNFDIWNEQKKQLQKSKTPSVHFKERDIWYIKLGKNLGFEQNGKGETFMRPVLIIKKFNHFVFWGIPLTSKIKSSRYYFRLKFIASSTKKEVLNTAILSQLRLFDSRRLSHKIGVVSAENILSLKKEINLLLNPSLTSKEGRPEGI